MSTPFDERWLKTGACVPIDIETTAALVVEIHRLIDVVGGMALAQPEQEPVAHWSDCAVHSEPAYPKGECDCGGFATPPQRPWVGLTNEERASFEAEIPKTQEEWDALFDGIEAKLKEQNT